jgi:group II intron reverse transcriptase/maturase
MRNAEAVLGIIQKRGREGLHLEDVYRQLYNPELYLRAYARLYRNQGAMTKGTTQETVDGMSRRKIENVIESLRFERYRWNTVRRVYIPKPNGKTRPLGIPTWTDKLLQEVMRSLLEAYYEPQFSSLSHGFRPNLGCHTALTEVYRTWKGVRWFIEGDIKGCFDNVDHQVLLSILREKIHDGRFIALVEKLLRAGYMEEWYYYPTISGTPQGGVISPILSNIYLDRLDKFVEQELIPRYTRGESRRSNPERSRLISRRRRLKAKGLVEEARRVTKEMRGIPCNDPDDPDYRRLRYIRYADDFLLGFTGPRDEAEEIKAKVRDFLSTQLKLELSEEKTLITHAHTQRARFLGYEVGVMYSDTRPSLNGVPDLRIPEDVLRKICDRYRLDGHAVPRPALIHDSDFDIVARYGMEYRGVAQYYQLAGNVNRLQKLRWVMEESLLKTLANKHRSTVKQMAEKYKTSTLTADLTAIKCIRVVVTREGKQPLVATFGDISLKRKKEATFPGENGRIDQLFTWRSELIQRLLADKCEWCGSSDRVEVHHVRGLKDLQKPGRKAKPGWMRVMAARRRKTMMLCFECHDALHQGRLDERPRQG